MAMLFAVIKQFFFSVIFFSVSSLPFRPLPSQQCLPPNNRCRRGCRYTRCVYMYMYINIPIYIYINILAYNIPFIGFNFGKHLVCPRAQSSREHRSRPCFICLGIGPGELVGGCCWSLILSKRRVGPRKTRRVAVPARHFPKTRGKAACSVKQKKKTLKFFRSRKPAYRRT